MKKIVMMCLVICMMSALLIPAFATEVASTDTLDDHLVVYYDFEGDTPEEQLADKAPAGKSKETLTVTSAAMKKEHEGVKDTTLSPNTGVRDGKLYIDHNEYDRAECKFDLTGSGENAQGADIFANTTGEFTIFVQTQLNTVCSDWIDFLTVQKLGRYYFSSYNQQVYSNFAVRHKGEKSITTTLQDNLYVYGTTLTFAVSYQYDQAAKTLKANVMFSLDEGASWSSFESEHSDVAVFFTDATAIYLGKNENSWTDRNGDVVLDNVRMYDKALTLDEIKTLVPYVNDDDEEVTSDDSSNASQAPANTNAPTNQETQTPVSTDSQAATTDSEKKNSGCSSVVMGSVMGLLPLIAGACLIVKKKD